MKQGEINSAKNLALMEILRIIGESVTLTEEQKKMIKIKLDSWLGAL